MPDPMSWRRRLAYAMGSAGFSLTDRIVYVVVIFFYLPPEGTGLRPLLGDEIFWGGLTAFGLATLIGRFFDAVADPFVGNASDRSRSRLGRRRVFMIWGVVPLVVIPALLFWPPGEPGSRANFYWLAGLLSLFYVFFTIYVAPYLALIPELAAGHAERVRLATLLAYVTFPVTIAFGAWAAGFDQLTKIGVDPTDAIRAVVVVLCVIAFVFCLMPIIGLDERRFASTQPSDLTLWPAIRATLFNRPFVVYLFAQIFFILGVNMISPVVNYYPRVVLGRTETFAALFGVVLAVGTVAGFPLVQRIGNVYGAKRTLMFCTGVFAVALGALGFLRPGEPGSAQDTFNLALSFAVMLACGIPIAGFMVVPAVIISQLVDRDEARTGMNRAAMFFGVQGLCTKFVYGVSGAILAFLFQRFGNSADEPLGVLLVGPVAGALCLVSALLYALYPESQVLEEGLGTAADPATESAPTG
ncbi:MAG TPA: MFS transporter [Myxococcota bacterium]|nr:MFS transporter [Myxococcota bacterium]